jgi:hypothetical protein
MANHYPDMVGEVDVITDAEVNKQCLWGLLSANGLSPKCMYGYHIEKERYYSW